MKEIFLINSTSPVPKYQQIIDQFLVQREKGHIEKGEQLPSIAGFARTHQVSLTTVARAYEKMKELGLVESRHGKGFYAVSRAANNAYNIFVLFDTFNPYKDILYNSFKKNLPPNATLELNFYHYNPEIFEQAILKSLGRYSHYVILPHLNQDLSAILAHIPTEKLILLDRLPKEIKGSFTAVYHDFGQSILESLKDALPLLDKYSGLDIILDLEHEIYIPEDLIRGLHSFTRKNKIKSQVIKGYQHEKIQAGKAYLIFSDNDMVNFIKLCKARKWKVGTDIGLIGYDDTPMKEILLSGITVISTDFVLMGATAAKLITENRKEIIKNPSGLIVRKSL
jgi:DNA-binding LacI/PurR family transcriptional regulator